MAHTGLPFRRPTSQTVVNPDSPKRSSPSFRVSSRSLPEHPRTPSSLSPPPFRFLVQTTPHSCGRSLAADTRRQRSLGATGPLIDRALCVRLALSSLLLHLPGKTRAGIRKGEREREITSFCCGALLLSRILEQREEVETARDAIEVWFFGPFRVNGTCVPKYQREGICRCGTELVIEAVLFAHAHTPGTLLVFCFASRIWRQSRAR